MQTTPRTATHPQGQEIEFHPEPHDYLLDGEKLTSVTTVIHRFFPRFDAEAVARKKAAREGGSFEALLEQWARKRDEAALFGTKAHFMADAILQTGDPQAADEWAESPREQAYLRAIQEALVRIEKAYEVVESEKIVFSPQLRIAGTVDLLLRSRASGEYVVADWKTNRELKFQSYGQEMGLGICSHLANCNFIHYSLQISAYSELLASEGYLTENQSVRGVLLHLAEKPGGLVVCDYVKTKDLRPEARAILND